MCSYGVYVYRFVRGTGHRCMCVDIYTVHICVVLVCTVEVGSLILNIIIILNNSLLSCDIPSAMICCTFRL